VSPLTTGAAALRRASAWVRREIVVVNAGALRVAAAGAIRMGLAQDEAPRLCNVVSAQGDILNLPLVALVVVLCVRIN
jgi:hypothetical protein